MVKGATQNETGHGLEIERQYLSQYLSQHYVNAGSLDLTSIDYSIGGSVTLEYAIDDFAIAQVAAAEHDRSLASTMTRARRQLGVPLQSRPPGYVQARGADGSFPPGAAFEASQLEPGGQTGFEEGNAVQYTWSVPQDLGALASLMGGDAAATAKLETFLTSLNATRDVPEDWSGNEPDEWAPWEFDYFGAPDETQRVVRAIVDNEYADAPVDEPGNDDLGALSSWYVWAALGLLPRDPGLGEPRARQPALPLRDHHAPGRSPPRRAGPGGGGLTALRPRADGLGRHPPAGGAGCLRGRTGRLDARRLGPDGTCPGCRPRSCSRAGRCDFTVSRARRPRLGLVTGREPTVVRHRAAPRRRLLDAERGRHRGDRPVHAGPAWRRSGDTGRHVRLVAGGLRSAGRSSQPVLGNARTPRRRARAAER